MEEWKDIPGYEGLYQASTEGRIRSLPKPSRIRRGNKIVPFTYPGKIISVSQTKKGYLMTALFKEGKLKSYTIHRLIANTFIPNPENLPQINHKNEIKNDNRVCNLEWCTNLYNRNYGTNKDNFKKKVIRVSESGEEVVYNSVTEGAKANGMNKTSVSACCRGKRKQAGGYKWKFLK